MGMMCGKNRTINFYSAFFDYFKCPRFTFPNRKAWRSKLFNRFSGYILKQFYRRTYIFFKSGPILLPDQLVIHRMATDFISFSNTFNKVRIGFGNPTDNEKRRL